MRTVVLGGTGFFGRLVVAALGQDPRFDVIVACRHPVACRQFAALDLGADDLDQRLARLRPDLIIHCAGPFQPEAYAVVEAALACGSHYLDLAEHPVYVLGIQQHDARARTSGLVVLSGVSSVPALSSAVVSEYAGHFRRLSAVDIGITSSELVPGTGAVAGVLEQCGQDVPCLPGASRRYAWRDHVRVSLPAPVGRRVLASCNVPDLTLLPDRFPGLERVSFRAGVPSGLVMWGLRRFAALRRMGWIRRPARWATWLGRGARCLEVFGNGASGMYVRLFGEGWDGVPRAIQWHLTATDNQGPLVPAQGVVSMAGMIASGLVGAGARPAFMELSTMEYLGDRLPVDIGVVRIDGSLAEEDEAWWRSR